MKCVSITLGSIVVIFCNSSKRGVMVDRAAIGSFREITLDTTNGECNKLKPFDRTDREPLNVTEGDGECMNISVVDI